MPLTSLMNEADSKSHSCSGKYGAKELESFGAGVG